MKSSYYSFFFILFFISSYAIGQNVIEAEEKKQEPSLFTEAEAEYISQWVITT